MGCLESPVKSLPFWNRLLTAAAALAASAALGAPPAPVQVPVMVIATFEAGKDTGDLPGELQFWVERQHLDQAIQVPGVDHPILTNGKGLYAMVSGTTSRCAVQLMALAADPRFDFRKTYFILDGIGGADPNECPLGSAVWVGTAVDGDPAFELDSRQMPASWPYGLVSFGATKPDQGPADVDALPAAGTSAYGTGGVGTVAFRLNPSLVAWAYGLTKGVALDDDPAMRAFGRRFTAYPEAQEPPRVMIGDSLGADRFFHGSDMMRWAEDWVRIFTKGEGKLAMSDCEDQGACIAFQRLGMMGKADPERLLILRTACNFVVPPPGVTPAESLFGDTVSDTGGMAYIPALEASYRVGSAVTAELLANWPKYRDRTP
jgi:purine nucleoside permease